MTGGVNNMIKVAQKPGWHLHLCFSAKFQFRVPYAFRFQVLLVSRFRVLAYGVY